MALIDWWSKYYTSTGQARRAPKYDGAGLDRLRVYDCELEKVDGFDAFSDFATSFDFAKGGGGRSEEGAID